MTRKNWAKFSVFGVGFAVVNFAEAATILISAGMYSPGWVMKYVSAYAKRRLLKRKAT